MTENEIKKLAMTLIRESNKAHAEQSRQDAAKLLRSYQYNIMSPLAHPRQPIYFDIPLLGDELRFKMLSILAWEINQKKRPGSVAEVGVNKGVFASKINAAFSDRKFYLFDSFDGFRDEEINADITMLGAGKGWKDISDRNYKGNSPDIAMAKMPYPDLCIIKKGWFPESAQDVDDKFAFVSLDTDLYAPILAGLNFFYPRLNAGGYIMVHNYRTHSLPGVEKAVLEFCENASASFIPIPDRGGSCILGKPLS